ncbi:MAG: cold shock domain-containing protein [Candidatus Methanofastidiosa archaeon]|nr:cold shock domain-containing protein [Candidatus Methanofastidiosa archaeon]
MNIANQAYDLLKDSRIALNAIGNAIVETAKEKEIIIKKKRNTYNYITKEKYEEEIINLKKLRDGLTADKNILKSQRDIFEYQVKSFNARTHSLKIAIRDRCGSKGSDWYSRLEARTHAKRLGLPIPQNQLSKDKDNKVESYGIVKWFNREKGFGFIISSNEHDNIYFNKKNIIDRSYLDSGDRVCFIIEQSNPQRLWARNVRKVL